MTLRELIEALRDDILAGLIGEYHHDKNPALNVDAITVGAGSPQGYTVRGLEVAIQQTPEDTPEPLLGDGHRVTRVWVVVLKAWDAQANLADAVERIVRAFPQTPAPTYVPATDVSIPQAIVRIPHQQHWEAQETR